MEKVHTHPVDLKKVYSKIDNWNISIDQKKAITDFLRAYQRGEITDNIPTDSTIERRAHQLRQIVENIKAETETGIRAFIDGILGNQIRSFNKDKKTWSGDPINLKRKNEIFAIARMWIDWKVPARKSATLTKLLKVKIRAKRNDIEILSDEEVKKLIDESPNDMKTFFLELMNYSGMRAEEFHNIRFTDIEMPSKKNENLVIHIKNETSKTEGRPIEVTTLKVIRAIKVFISKRLKDGMKPDEPIFPVKYYSNQKWIRNYGKRVLDGKRVYYHIFRHTSATRWASKMNRTQFCIFFGWKFNSPMPDIYIKRAGVDMKQAYESLGRTEREADRERLELLEQVNEKLESKSQRLDKMTELAEEKIKELEESKKERIETRKDISRLRKDIEAFRDAMLGYPNATENQKKILVKNYGKKVLKPMEGNRPVFRIS